MLAYLKSVFSADDCASFARWATAVTVLTSCGCLAFVVVKTHALPDATALGGLSVFATAPYGIGKIAQAWLNRQPTPGTTGPLNASAYPIHQPDPTPDPPATRFFERAILITILALFVLWLCTHR